MSAMDDRRGRRAQRSRSSVVLGAIAGAAALGSFVINEAPEPSFVEHHAPALQLQGSLRGRLAVRATSNPFSQFVKSVTKMFVDPKEEAAGVLKNLAKTSATEAESSLQEMRSAKQAGMKTVNDLKAAISAAKAAETKALAAAAALGSEMGKDEWQAAFDPLQAEVASAVAPLQNLTKAAKGLSLRQTVEAAQSGAATREAAVAKALKEYDAETQTAIAEWVPGATMAADDGNLLRMIVFTKATAVDIDRELRNAAEVDQATSYDVIMKSMYSAAKKTWDVKEAERVAAEKAEAEKSFFSAPAPAKASETSSSSDSSSSDEGGGSPLPAIAAGVLALAAGAYFAVSSGAIKVPDTPAAPAVVQAAPAKAPAPAAAPAKVSAPAAAPAKVPAPAAAPAKVPAPAAALTNRELMEQQRKSS